MLSSPIVDILTCFIVDLGMTEKGKTIQRKLTGVRLSPDVVKKLKYLALKQDKSLNALLKEAVEELLKKYSKK